MTKILVLGGNGFIGSCFVKFLLANPKGKEIEVSVANRGKSWDWDTQTSIKPHVKCFYFDRDKNSYDNSLVEYIKATYFDMVVDFSAYYGYQVEQALNLLDGHASLYVYISSDSVYEVCDKKHNGPSKEEDAVRPAESKLYKKLQRRDSYGHEKFCGEEVLQDQVRQSNAIPFIILRLADVIGAEDSTNRCWKLQLLVQLSLKSKYPVPLPTSLRHRFLSFTFVEDVAEIIKSILKSQEVNPTSTNTAYNCACIETRTMADIVQIISAELTNDDSVSCSVQYIDSEDLCELYPSVDLGPVEVKKACQTFSWNPNSIQGAFKKIVPFYVQIVKDDLFRIARIEIMQEFVSDFRSVLYKGFEHDLRMILGLSIDD